MWSKRFTEYWKYSEYIFNTKPRLFLVNLTAACSPMLTYARLFQCFMNSVIQCLSNTRPLLEYLLNEQYLADINTTTSSMKGALIKAFSQVIHELWEVGGDHVVNTTALKSQIQRFAPRFMGYSQQDAQEFLRYLLEGLHEDVNRVTTKLPPIHGDIPDSYT